MKKFSLFIVAILMLAVMIPAASFAQERQADTQESAKAVNYNQGIHEITLQDGATVKVGFSSTEYPVRTSATSGCSNGNHTNKHYYGGIDATRIHQAAASHPCYCTVVYSENWQCSACNSYGVDKRSILVWCPSINTVDDEIEPDLEFTFTS